MATTRSQQHLVSATICDTWSMLNMTVPTRRFAVITAISGLLCGLGYFTWSAAVDDLEAELREMHETAEEDLRILRERTWERPPLEGTGEDCDAYDVVRGALSSIDNLPTAEPRRGDLAPHPEQARFVEAHREEYRRARNATLCSRTRFAVSDIERDGLVTLDEVMPGRLEPLILAQDFRDPTACLEIATEVLFLVRDLNVGEHLFPRLRNDRQTAWVAIATLLHCALLSANDETLARTFEGIATLAAHPAPAGALLAADAAWGNEVAAASNLDLVESSRRAGVVEGVPQLAVMLRERWDIAGLVLAPDALLPLTWAQGYAVLARDHRALLQVPSGDSYSYGPHLLQVLDSIITVRAAAVAIEAIRLRDADGRFPTAPPPSLGDPRLFDLSSTPRPMRWEARGKTAAIVAAGPDGTFDTADDRRLYLHTPAQPPRMVGPCFDPSWAVSECPSVVFESPTP